MAGNVGLAKSLIQNTAVLQTFMTTILPNVPDNDLFTSQTSPQCSHKAHTLPRPGPVE